MRSALLGVLGGALAATLTVGASAPATSAGGDRPPPSGTVRAPHVAIFDVTTSDGRTSTARIHADGSRFHRLTRPVADFTSSLLSPDRSTVLIRDYPMVLDVMDPTGAGRRTIFTSEVNQFSYPPVWSPDSSAVLVTADRGSGPELLTVPVDGGDPTHLAWAGSSTAYSIAPAAWSPDGSLGVFQGLRDDDGTERPVYLGVRADGGPLRELAGWQAYAPRPGAQTGVAVVRTADGADIVQVGARLAPRRTLLSVGPAEQTPDLVWSHDGRRFAVLHGDPGHQRIEVLTARGRVVQHYRPRQPRGSEGVVGVLQISSGGSLLSWSYANFVGKPFTRAEGLFLRDLHRRRTCRKAAPGPHQPFTAVTFAPNDRYAVLQRDGKGVTALLALDEPRRPERVRWVADGAVAANVQFLRRTGTTVATRPCRR